MNDIKMKQKNEKAAPTRSRWNVDDQIKGKEEEKKPADNPFLDIL